MKIKSSENIKKHYIYLNIVALLLSIYVMFFPYISKLITSFIPQFGICPYLAITGTPCPLCGGTRYIAGIGQALKNPTYLLHPFGIIMICILLELIFRIIILIKKDKLKNINRIIKYDIIIHAILFALFIGYEIMFFVI